MVRGILSARKADARMQNSAVVAIQEAAQAYLVGLFQEANLIAIHSKRTTIAARDLRLVRRLHGDVKEKRTDAVPPPPSPVTPTDESPSTT